MFSILGIAGILWTIIVGLFFYAWVTKHDFFMGAEADNDNEPNW